jgi:5-methylcytosine-specific restriction endonuclease McrA
MTNAREFTVRLTALLRREHAAMADFLVALADFDRQKLWRELGHASLFSFLRRELGLSAGAAQYRKSAAELVQRFPEVEAALRAGRLCLSSVIELAKVITPENAAEVLPRFFGLSSRDAALVAVSIRPVENAPRRDVVTPLLPARPPLVTGVREAAHPPAAADEAATLAFRAPEMPSPARATAPAEPSSTARRLATPPSFTVEPLDEKRVRLHITVSRRFLAKLDATKAALSHARPGATAEEVLEACLDLMLAKHASRKELVERPRKTAAPVTSDAIPAAVRREVWHRAGGRCEWPLDAGGVCASTLHLELDHVVPRARGGPSTIANLRVLCRAHNQLAARRVFGDEWMDRYAKKRSPIDVAKEMAPTGLETAERS